MPSSRSLVIFLFAVDTTVPGFYTYTPTPHAGCLLRKQLDHSLIKKSLRVSRSLGLGSSEESTPTLVDVRNVVLNANSNLYFNRCGVLMGKQT